MALLPDWKSDDAWRRLVNLLGLLDALDGASSFLCHPMGLAAQHGEGTCCCKSRPKVEIVNADKPWEQGQTHEQHAESASHVPHPHASLQRRDDMTGGPGKGALANSRDRRDETSRDHGERSASSRPVGKLTFSAAGRQYVEYEAEEESPPGIERDPSQGLQLSRRASNRSLSVVFSAPGTARSRLAPPLCDVSLRVGVCSIQNGRAEMEDTYCNMVTEEGECTPVPRTSSGKSFFPENGACVPEALSIRGFFGVFDGHGGSDAAQFVSSQIYDAFLQQCFITSGPWNADVTRSVMRNAFIEMERAVQLRSRAQDWVAGTTAAVVAVFDDDERLALVAGNIGDSEILLGRRRPESSPEFVLLSEIHNIEKNDSERARVEAEGGRVYHDRLGHPKFNPQFTSLGVSRALGDGLYKDTEFTGGRPSGLSTEPFVTHRELCQFDSFVLVGCDGFFAGVQYLEAVESVFRQLDAGKDVQSVSEAMVELAQCRGSRDNITVVLVTF